MNTVLVTIGNTFQARDLLRSDFFKLLKEDNLWRVILLVPSEKIEHYRQVYGGGRVVVEINPTKREKLNKFETLAYVLGHYSIPSNTTKILHNRLKNRPLVYLLSNFCWFLGHTRLWREFIRWLFARATSGSHFRTLLDKYKPDLVYTVNLLNFDEFRLLYESRRRGIKTYALILSWDNLNSKLFIYFKARNYIVPNSFIKEELVGVGDVSPNRVNVSGTVKYDGYFRKEGIVSKKEFFRQLGIPADNKLVVYCLSTKNTSPVYEDIFDDLISIKNEISSADKISWIIRGYPKYILPSELIDKIKRSGFIYNHPSDFSDSGRDYEIKNEDDAFLHNLFFHADLFITNYSTVVVEASIYDKPIININYDGKIDKPYSRSVKRVRDYTHYRQIIEAEGEDYVNNKTELATLITKYLRNPELRRAGRARVVREQCVFTDGQSGRRMYEYLVSLI